MQLFPSYNIEEQKWERCLKAAINPLIYTSLDYLNTMADNWDAIIIGDYDYIMPIPWRKKFGIRYCYHVPFIQQLGVFGKDVTEEIVANCFALLIKNFKYGDYAFNNKNVFTEGKSSNNYTLSLASNYRSTSFFYSDKLKADLLKIQPDSFDYKEAAIDEAMFLYRKLYAHRFPYITDDDFKKFETLCRLKEKEKNLVVRKISSANTTRAINLLLKDKFRLYNLIACVTTEGRSMFAGHALHDNIIKEFSQSGLVLDFEGSDIPGVNHFYKSFGAINQPYSKIHFNNLPKVLRLLKR